MTYSTLGASGLVGVGVKLDVTIFIVVNLQLHVTLQGDITLAREGALPHRAPSSVPEVVGVEFGGRNANSNVGGASLLSTIDGATAIDIVLVQVSFSSLVKGTSTMTQQGRRPTRQSRL